MLDAMNADGLPARYLYPILEQPVYRRLLGDLTSSYPVAARIGRAGIAIGTHAGLSSADIDRYAEVIERSLDHARR
jgi:dTDP-4-amino-4,6-dideoxygalactose transaminase